MALYDPPGLYRPGGRALNPDGTITIVCLLCERPIIKTRYQGFSTAVHGRCEKLYNDGMSPEEIQSMMATVETPEEQTRAVLDDLGQGLFKAAGFKKRVKKVMEEIRQRVTGKRRNILKD